HNAGKQERPAQRAARSGWTAGGPRGSEGDEEADRGGDPVRSARAECHAGTGPDDELPSVRHDHTVSDVPAAGHHELLPVRQRRAVTASAAGCPQNPPISIPCCSTEEGWT